MKNKSIKMCLSWIPIVIIFSIIYVWIGFIYLSFSYNSIIKDKSLIMAEMTKKQIQSSSNDFDNKDYKKLYKDIVFVKITNSNLSETKQTILQGGKVETILKLNKKQQLIIHTEFKDIQEQTSLHLLVCIMSTMFLLFVYIIFVYYIKINSINIFKDNFSFSLLK